MAFRLLRSLVCLKEIQPWRTLAFVLVNLAMMVDLGRLLVLQALR